MIESDMGAFLPYGLGFTGHPMAKRQLETLAPLLGSIGAGNVSDGGGGVDIGPSCATGVPCGEPNVLDPRLTQDSNNPCRGYTEPTGALPAAAGDWYCVRHVLAWRA